MDRRAAANSRAMAAGNSDDTLGDEHLAATGGERLLYVLDEPTH